MFKLTQLMHCTVAKCFCEVTRTRHASDQMHLVVRKTSGSIPTNHRCKSIVVANLMLRLLLLMFRQC